MPATKCQANYKNGTPCNAYAATGSDFCYHHDPDRAAERRLARSKGGRARHGRVIGPVGVQPLTPSIDLDTMAGVAILIQSIIADILSLENSSRRARTVGYLAALLIKALDSATFEQRLTHIESILDSREKGT